MVLNLVVIKHIKSMHFMEMESSKLEKLQLNTADLYYCKMLESLRNSAEKMVLGSFLKAGHYVITKSR